MDTTTLVVWALVGAALGAHAARRKRQSIGVGVVVGGVLGPFAVLLYLARQAPVAGANAPESHGSATKAVGCIIATVVLFFVVGVVLLVIAARGGMRFPG